MLAVAGKLSKTLYTGIDGGSDSDVEKLISLHFSLLGLMLRPVCVSYCPLCASQSFAAHLFWSNADVCSCPSCADEKTHFFSFLCRHSRRQMTTAASDPVLVLCAASSVPWPSRSRLFCGFVTVVWYHHAHRYNPSIVRISYSRGSSRCFHFRHNSRDAFLVVLPCRQFPDTLKGLRVSFTVAGTVFGFVVVRSEELVVFSLHGLLE